MLLKNHVPIGSSRTMKDASQEYPQRWKDVEFPSDYKAIKAKKKKKKGQI